MATQNFESLRARVQALGSAIADLGATVKEIDAAKESIDNPTASKLKSLEQQLTDILNDARYEGVDYEDDDEPDELGVNLRKLAAIQSAQGNTRLEEALDRDGIPDDRPPITVLVGDHVEAIHALQGVAEALVKLRLDNGEDIGLELAARSLSRTVAGGLGSLVDEDRGKIEAATGWRVHE